MSKLEAKEISKNMERDAEWQKDIDAFDRLKEKYPDMFVENAEDFVKETENTTGYTGG